MPLGCSWCFVALQQLLRLDQTLFLPRLAYRMSARSVRLEALPPVQLLQEANRLRAENVALRDELARANNLAAAQRLMRGVADPKP